MQLNSYKIELCITGGRGSNKKKYLSFYTVKIAQISYKFSSSTSVDDMQVSQKSFKWIF